ncbi:Arginase/deacetylase [Fistulina hepatica ATCC 64428]|uniref:Arginase/deacetylase n=1 Tax=Fistulina hepatica ATCC 64428 TaxID=1128425 RepID=A0A0D7AKB4_9AGAR|nr:Arginase/deacetylase [Fistulina hepatica ATCC 64428]
MNAGHIYKVLEDASHPFHIAILGMPFNTTTSYRPGAQFGPFAIRTGSRRQTPRGYTLAWNNNPHVLGVDCGEVPITPISNIKAVDQMEAAYISLLNKPVKGGRRQGASTYRPSRGGGHTIVPPILGPLSVIHFDAHIGLSACRDDRTRLTLFQMAVTSPNSLSDRARTVMPSDTWSPAQEISDKERITHGSFFFVAAEEHLMADTTIHDGPSDVDHDDSVGFQLITAKDMDDYGQRAGVSSVYLSLDIDVLDPTTAPATGTLEAGGWTTREIMRILRGLTADVTGIVTADIVHDLLNMVLLEGPSQPHVGPCRSAEPLL